MTQPDAPIVITNLLTNEVYEYSSVTDVLRQSAVFTFVDWAPSIYEIRNMGAGTLPVSLGGRSYNVALGQLWTFNANREGGGLVGWRYVSGTRVYG